MNYKEQISQVYSFLYDLYGPQYWWPAETPWEVAVGAVLTQNTNWKNVEKAIWNLKEKNLIKTGQGGCDRIKSPLRLNWPENFYSDSDAQKILKTPAPELAELIRPSGYYNSKAKKLHALAEWWINNVNKQFSELYTSPQKEINEESHFRNHINVKLLRNSLLSVYGIGPETADSISLYAFNLPVFVIDTYTKRLSSIVLGTDPNIKYEQLQVIYTENLPEDQVLFNEFHALIVCHLKNKEWKNITKHLFFSH